MIQDKISYDLRKIWRECKEIEERERGLISHSFFLGQRAYRAGGMRAPAQCTDMMIFTFQVVADDDALRLKMYESFILGWEQENLKTIDEI